MDLFVIVFIAFVAVMIVISAVVFGFVFFNVARFSGRVFRVVQIQHRCTRKYPHRYRGDLAMQGITFDSFLGQHPFYRHHQRNVRARY